jgi:hypothetical protein
VTKRSDCISLDLGVLEVISKVGSLLRAPIPAGPRYLPVWSLTSRNAMTVCDRMYSVRQIDNKERNESCDVGTCNCRIA